MKRIQELVDQIDEELESAKDYAEEYIDRKAKNDTNLASRFKQMATEELGHADTVHEIAVKEIDQLSRVYTPPVEMENTWKMAHKEYIEKAAWIKQMLTM